MTKLFTVCQYKVLAMEKTIEQWTVQFFFNLLTGKINITKYIADSLLDDMEEDDAITEDQENPDEKNSNESLFTCPLRSSVFQS